MMKQWERLKALTYLSLALVFTPWQTLCAADITPSGELACTHTTNGSVSYEITTFHEISSEKHKDSSIYEVPTTTYEPTSPDTQVTVKNTDDFLKALRGTASTIILAYNGDFIFPAAHIQFGNDSWASAIISRNVKIIGERGPQCERPRVSLSEKKSGAIWGITEGNVEIRGIHFIGPATEISSDVQGGNLAIQAVRDLESNERLLIIDNEFEKFTASVVRVNGIHDVRSYAEYQNDWLHPTETSGDKVRIERNYFHHIVGDGVGACIAIGGGIHTWIIGNLFNYCRHDVASNGFAYAGYTAKFNYMMEGAYKEKDYYNQHFDVRGTAPTANGTTSGYGETAGDKFLISNNTIRGAQKYGGALGILERTRPAFMLRGKANSWAHFNDNIVVHGSAGEAITVKNSKSNPEPFTPYNLSQTGNQYGIDNVNRMLIGDFDGDGLTDLMLTNGTAWWVSRNIERPWEFLHASSKLSNELAIFDVDGDKVDGLLFKEGAAIKYLPRGSGNPKTLATLPADSLDLSMESVATNGNKICFVNKRGKTYCLKGNSWSLLDDKGKSIAIDSDGSLWLVKKSGEIFRHTIDSKVDIFWEKQRGSDGVKIASGSGEVWLINTAGRIYKWGKLKWNQMPGSSAKNITVSKDGKVVFLTNTLGLNYKWNGTSWSRLYGDF